LQFLEDFEGILNGANDHNVGPICADYMPLDAKEICVSIFDEHEVLAPFYRINSLEPNNNNTMFEILSCLDSNLAHCNFSTNSTNDCGNSISVFCYNGNFFSR
jgi:hypothetical protein